MTYTTHTISSINLSDNFESKVFLTFDIDWAHDDVLSDTIDILDCYSVSATFFATHVSPTLERITANPLYELGIHPNFNPLIEKNSILNCNSILEDIISIVPTAKSVRCHSMFQSSRILDIIASHNITHDVNHFIPYQSGINLLPWLHWNKLIRVPYFWEDDVHILYNSIASNNLTPRDILQQSLPGIKVFDFHPIHIFLNTDSLALYDNSRPYLHNPTRLQHFRNPLFGTRNLLVDLLEYITVS